jgi:osmotically-inducible protein OsmY
MNTAKQADTQQILQAVRAALRSEPRLGAAFKPGHLDIDADGVLVFEGEVESVAQKKIAMRRAAAIPEVRGLVDRLRVRPATPMGDDEIREHLRHALTGEPSFIGLRIREWNGDTWRVVGGPDEDGQGIDYEVNEGVVTLDGSVMGLASKRLAGVLAWWVPGSRDVINGMAVDPDEQDGPDRIEEAVRIVLEKDPYIDAGQVRVGVRLRVVRLTGLLSSEAQRHLAEMDAWYVFGVDEVVNEIEVGR